MSQSEFEYLGPYKVERTLGRGGMGTVYKGTHVKSGDAVAIKVIASGIANNMRFRRRFAAEVETLKRLRHPNIVQLVGYGEEEGMLFYSMEYVDGHSLHDHLRQHERLPWQEVLQVGIETTAALKHAHDLGIIHRDLKPANLMVNGAGQVKLTDFGIAKLFGSSDMTADGSVIGTADYMPPEQAEGKPVTIRSDLYSLGGVLYALLAGKAPFGGKTVPEVLYSVRYNPVPGLRERVEDVPDELAELVYQLLEKDPLKRPPTALVVGNRLKSLQQGLQRGSHADASGTGTQDSMKPLGTHLTSLDLSDVEDHELKLTGEEPLPTDAGSQDASPDTHGGAAPPVGTHEQQTMLASDSLVGAPSNELLTSQDEDAEHNSRAAAARPAAEGPAAGRNLKHPSTSHLHSSGTGSGQSTSSGPSHFTPISADAARHHVTGLETTSEAPAADWLHYLSMVGIVVVLLASMGLGWWLLRPASADSLYGEVMSAVDSGDDTRLVQAGVLIDEFLTRFPEDERVSELETLANEVQLVRWTRILKRRASRSGGEEQLNAVEQGFLDSMQLLNSDASLAQSKLAAFVSVFGAIEDLPADERKLVELAQYALESGLRAPPHPTPVAAQQLQDLIQAAEDSLTPEQRTPFYRNLLLLYGDKPWAEEQLARIRQILQAES